MKRSYSQLEAEAFPEDPCQKRRSYGVQCQVQNDHCPSWLPLQQQSWLLPSRSEVLDYFDFHRHRFSTKNDYETILKPQLEDAFALITQQNLTLDHIHAYGTRWLLNRGLLYVVAQPVADDVLVFREWQALRKSLLWLRSRSPSIVQRANFDATIQAMDAPEAFEFSLETLRATNEHLQVLWRQSAGSPMEVPEPSYLDTNIATLRQWDDMEISSPAC
ncbi:hypothetical protein EJ05DRAFT_472077 [Pseudovirgaria hyperparasitica]|uniref:Uncharacterized protein n=1 Tax=Pseudovirgaria hyperparasitica TaxID=470096 RepID=A0A6A6WLS0_9PEZI|nr:uncharacterized protein EJ05DRAFT_472077 [Pseudovirgaria hyperparasitica]KAF2763147.1 hypothetical protein EJ05DRAFT_472077 [Pseudovirgaria hyperparasitica]